MSCAESLQQKARIERRFDNSPIPHSQMTRRLARRIEELYKQSDALFGDLGKRGLTKIANRGLSHAARVAVARMCTANRSVRGLSQSGERQREAPSPQTLKLLLPISRREKEDHSAFLARQLSGISKNRGFSHFFSYWHRKQTGAKRHPPRHRDLIAKRDPCLVNLRVFRAHTDQCLKEGEMWKSLLP